MPDILESIQQKTRESPPPEPAPEPVSSTQTTTQKIPMDSSSALVDSLIRQTEQQAASPPPPPQSTVVPSVPPKKKRSGKGAIIVALLLLLITLPIGVYFISQQSGRLAEIRGRAAYPTPPSCGCPPGSQCEVEIWGWHDQGCFSAECPEGNRRRVQCDWSEPDGFSCVEPGSNAYLNQCEDIYGNHHWLAECVPDPTCVQDKTKNSDILTFETGKTAVLYLAGFVGSNVYTVTLTNTVDTSDIVTVNSGTIGQNQSQVFTNVKQIGTNNQYRVKVHLSGDPADKDAYGWINPNGTSCGKNGHETEVGQFINAGTAASSPPHLVMCWADAEIGDWTQDYDFNDFMLVFGYTQGTEPTSTPIPGVCMSSCNTNNDCQSSLQCTNGACRNPACATDALDPNQDCNCEPTPTPTPSVCQNIHMYKADGTDITATLKNGTSGVVVGDTITIGIVGGTAEKARIRVNGGQWMETTNKNSSGEYVVNWTIVSSLPNNQYTIEAEVYSNGVWK